MTEWIILTIPFAGTALGAAMVFLLKNGLGSRVKKLLLGFASGVMIAASVWYFVRNRRAGGWFYHDSHCRLYFTGFAVSFIFCGGSHDLCGSGGTDSGIPKW